MKRFILTVLMVLAGVVGIVNKAQAYDSCMTGAWVDSSLEAEGFSLEFYEDFAVGFQYTYKRQSDGHQWFVFGFDDEGNGKMHTTADKDNLTEHQVGIATLDVVDEDTLLIVVHQSLDLDNGGGGTPWCIGCNDEYVLDRLTQPVPCPVPDSG